MRSPESATASPAGIAGVVAGTVSPNILTPSATVKPQTLERARRRLKRIQRGLDPPRAPRMVTKPLIEQVAGQKSEGKTRPQVAAALGLSEGTVRRVERHPEFQAVMTSIRERIRTETVSKLLETHRKVWTLFVASVEAGSTKDADNMARVLLNLEKIAASSSGEARKLETLERHELVEGTQDRETQELLRAIAGLLNPPNHLSPVPIGGAAGPGEGDAAS